MYTFFVQTLFWQLFSSYMFVEKAVPKRHSYKKFVREMLMKLTETLYNFLGTEEVPILE